MPDWNVFIGCLIILWSFVFFQGFLAWTIGFLTREQMFCERGIKQGDSFMQHGGMWVDVIVISPIISYILAVPHHLDVRSQKSWIVLLIALVFWLGALKYFALLAKSRPEAHAYQGKITAA